ncbi:U-box domain-containing protein 4 [Sesamum alatum]|uniref:U-box domain-containing protein 4 n=1 Tax=Sesamum alatum TaxID=300844 RepID=A0AAE1Y2C2_9LAMI|nr:U-box domain-containing protein 4 [Sesamum alatum]
MRTRCQAFSCRPSERFGLRVVSSPTIGMRAELLEVEPLVKKLIEDLKNGSIDVQTNATAKIRLLAKHNMDNRIIIANCRAISLFVNLLRSIDSIVQENAVTALLNLSINDNKKSAIANADAIEPLIHIGRLGPIKPLDDLLGNGTPRGKKDAAAALFNLSINHENNARIVPTGAVKYIVELIDPAFGMVVKAVAVLSNLATIHEGRMAIGQEGGITFLVEVVELGSGRGKENAAATLLQLCTNSNQFCNMVLQEGVVPGECLSVFYGSFTFFDKAGLHYQSTLILPTLCHSCHFFNLNIVILIVYVMESSNASGLQFYVGKGLRHGSR